MNGKQAPCVGKGMIKERQKALEKSFRPKFLMGQPALLLSCRRVCLFFHYSLYFYIPFVVIKAAKTLVYCIVIF